MARGRQKLNYNTNWRRQFNKRFSWRLRSFDAFALKNRIHWIKWYFCQNVFSDFFFHRRLHQQHAIVIHRCHRKWRHVFCRLQLVRQTTAANVKRLVWFVNIAISSPDVFASMTNGKRLWLSGATTMPASFAMWRREDARMRLVHVIPRDMKAISRAHPKVYFPIRTIARNITCAIHKVTTSLWRISNAVEIALSQRPQAIARSRWMIPFAPIHNTSVIIRAKVIHGPGIRTFSTFAMLPMTMEIASYIQQCIDVELRKSSTAATAFGKSLMVETTEIRSYADKVVSLAIRAIVKHTIIAIIRSNGSVTRASPAPISIIERKHACEGTAKSI